MIDWIYKPIWVVLDLFITTYENLYWLCLRLQAVVLWSYDHWYASSSSNSRRDRAFLQHCKTELTKLPQHLNIIIGPDYSTSVDKNTISQIALYALLIGIDCISLYDMRPKTKGRVLFKNLPIPADVGCDEVHEHHYVWRLKDSLPAAKNGIINVGLKNGFANGNISQNGARRSSQSSIELYQITPKDNKPLLAKVCQGLFEKRKSAEVQNLLKDRKLLEQCITETLSTHFQWKFLEPDLSILFHPHASTFGILPWQTRFTEIHTFETGRYFNARSFAKLLYCYSRCEQRWGK